MPRYFLHLKIDSVYFPDATGQELSDLLAAHSRAVQKAGKLIPRLSNHIALAKPWIVDIEDDKGELLLEVILNPQQLIAKSCAPAVVEAGHVKPA